MPYLVMCEGSCEVAIMDILLDAGKLIFTRDDLVDMRVFHARQLTESEILLVLTIYPGNFDILRVGDTMTDKLRIPKEYKDRVLSVEKYCTLPELEMLLIINNNLQNEFTKVKCGTHKIKPKTFSKQNIKFNGKRYDGTPDFWRRYYCNRINELENDIKKYKRTNKAHHKDQRYVADLLK